MVDGCYTVTGWRVEAWGWSEAIAMGSTTLWLGVVGLLLLGQPVLGLNRANKKPDSNIRHGKSKDTTQ